MDVFNVVGARGAPRAYAHCAPLGAERDTGPASVTQGRRATCRGCRNAALEERGFQRVSEGGGESRESVARDAGGGATSA